MSVSLCVPVCLCVCRRCDDVTAVTNHPSVPRRRPGSRWCSLPPSPDYAGEIMIDVGIRGKCCRQTGAGKDHRQPVGWAPVTRSRSADSRDICIVIRHRQEQLNPKALLGGNRSRRSLRATLFNALACRLCYKRNKVSRRWLEDDAFHLLEKKHHFTISMFAQRPDSAVKKQPTATTKIYKIIANYC